MEDAGGQQVLSPYHAMGFNPVSMVDPLGLQYFAPASTVIHQDPSAFIRAIAPTLGMHLPGGSLWGMSNMSRYISSLPKDLQAEAWMMYLSGGAAGEGSFQSRLGDYLQERAAKGRDQKGNWKSDLFIHFVYNLDNGYDIFDEKGNIIMTFLNAQVVHGFNYTGFILEKMSGFVSQQSSGGDGNFLTNNWQDVAFMANDLAQVVGNNSTLNTALRMGRPTTVVHIPPGIRLTASTKVMSSISKVTTPIAKAAPWVAGGAIAYNVINNSQITAGDVYQGFVTGLSVIPGWGLAVGGISLLAEGISYYYTGQSISDNINESMNGGVIRKW